MIELQVEGMTCGSCTEHVRQALEQVAGVRSVSVSYPQGLAAVATAGQVSLGPIIAAVTALGYGARVVDSSSESAVLFDQTQGRPGREAARADGEQPLHIAVIGSGGAAMAAA
ncbi:MAG: cation transporter, partial [Pseudomonas sp.]|uniref:cation transporter n=1 Tax=Pseudomonas sp. TaxID=306 RepID=UPI003BB6A9CA